MIPGRLVFFWIFSGKVLLSWMPCFERAFSVLFSFQKKALLELNIFNSSYMLVPCYSIQNINLSFYRVCMQNVYI